MEGINNFVYCSKCGSKNNRESSFCRDCGTKLTKDGFSRDNLKKTFSKEGYTNKNTYSEYNYTNNEYVRSNYTTEELQRFVEKNQGYYLRKFNLMNSTGEKISWNWSSFLCGASWLLYRKMYLQALIYFVARLILVAIPFIGWIFNLALWIALGMFGNSLYLDHVNRKFEEISFADSSLRKMLINKKGGTNLALALVLAFLPIIVVFIAIIIGAAFSAPFYYY